MLLSSLFLGCLSDNSKKAQAQLQADNVNAEMAAQERFIAKGKELFKINCARCHDSRLEKDSTGPALMGVRQRVPAGDWIYNFIWNSDKMISEGDPDAVRLFNRYPGVMDPNPHLSRADIDAILAWIDSYEPAVPMPSR